MLGGVLALAYPVDSSAAGAKGKVIDRVVAKFTDPEAGESVGSLRFVMMRELIL
jgi:hypothetical protein